MKFLIDECTDIGLGDHLRSRGHDASSIVKDYPRSRADQDVLAIAQNEGRVLITDDTDFGELVFLQDRSYAGVILFRLGPRALALQQDRLDYLLDHHAEELNGFVVVDEDAIRIRDIRGTRQLLAF